MKNNFFMFLIGKKSLPKKNAVIVKQDKQSDAAKIIPLYQKRMLQKQQAKIVSMFG